jgi:methylase of polypeptide subunit release factors
MSRVNAALAGVEAEVVRSDVLDGVDGALDVIVANPPYLRDPLHRRYRDGGGRFGEELALRILEQSLERLSPRGTLLLYTGAPIIDGRDFFHEQALPLLRERGARHTYYEIDPDVFGEELELEVNAGVERFAAVALCARLP